MSLLTDPAKQWLLGYVLQNLTCKKPFDSEYMAIVPHSDPRVQEIAANSALERSLVENFTDQFGKKRNPSVLIVRNDAPAQVRTIDAAVCFRNLVAISCVVQGRQESLGQLNVRGTLYTDFFDFYPTTITADRTAVRTISPALDGWDQPQEFHGMTSPGLPSTEWVGVEPEESLLRPLMEAWNNFYTGPKLYECEATGLFRSLQVAYHAAAMPASNQQSIYDFGVRVGLWVSAFEILAHPRLSGGKGNANFKTVKELLEKQTWSNAELRDCKHDVHYDNECHKANLVVKLYRDLYKARNCFLHGNAVLLEHLFPFKNNKRPPLTHLAPLIYRAALLGFLDRFAAPVKEPAPDLAAMEMTNERIDQAFATAMKRRFIENALLTATKDHTD